MQLIPGTQPWLTVIVPVHNGERWLDIALQSVADQNDSGIEVIVIDSSVMQDCIDIAAGFSDRLNIQIHKRPDLLSWTVKTNFGAAQARADWICMLHQDDFWLPFRSDMVHQWLITYPASVMHLHSSYIVDSSGRKLGLWRCPLPVGDAPIPPETLLERLIVQNFIAIPAATIQRDAFLDVGGLDEALWYTADWDLYLKLSSVGGIYYHDEPLACFRVHGNSLTLSGSRSIEDFRDQQEQVPLRHVNRLPASRRTIALRLAAASTEVNTALAGVINGDRIALLKALRAILMLGPCLMARYFYYSRILERFVPRLRALLSSGL